ncbi:MAG: hypothetical protein KF861_14690 [Planctomycetaceae bacterium]|nr:hypothetical protein [Planctomycetaceae bacterium]
MIKTASSGETREAQISCACCDHSIALRHLFCPNCHAPMEVSQAVASRGAPPRFLTLLGPSGAGKTVFLGVLLDMLSKGSRPLRGLPNGPFSLAVQQETIDALQKQRFPEKTPSEADQWRWVHCEVSSTKRPKRVLDIVTPDLAGEAIALELEHENSHPVIRSVIGKSAGLLVLFDSGRARDDGRTEDLFAMKLISYLANVYRASGPLQRRKCSVPLSIILTKSDSCPEALRNPEEFAAAAMPGLVQGCRRHFAHYRFFASGIVGSYALGLDGYGRRLHMPLHVEPHGILEPLEWLMEQL